MSPSRGVALEMAHTGPRLPFPEEVWGNPISSPRGQGVLLTQGAAPSLLVISGLPA